MNSFFHPKPLRIDSFAIFTLSLPLSRTLILSPPLFLYLGNPSPNRRRRLHLSPQSQPPPPPPPPPSGMDPTSSNLSPISSPASPNFLGFSTHFCPIPGSMADLEDDSLIVPDTPDYMLDSWWESDSVSTIVPENPWTELDSVSTIVPQTSLTEFDSVGTIVPETPSTVVPETLATATRGKRPVEEEEWFKRFLVMLLPGMADLL